jgi:hypothetical protein
MSFYFYPSAKETSNRNSSKISLKTIHLNQPKSADRNFKEDTPLKTNMDYLT